MSIKKIIFGAIFLLTPCFLRAQDGNQFEMSSSQYAVAQSAFVNASSVISGHSYVLRQQFGATNTGRMEGATYKVGTLVQMPEESAKTVAGDFRLRQNYPNPFNQSTLFRYNVPREADVTISILSILGREIVTLYKGRQCAGVFELPFRGINALGAPLPSGVYFCRMSTKGFDKTIKFAILR